MKLLFIGETYKGKYGVPLDPIGWLGFKTKYPLKVVSIFYEASQIKDGKALQNNAILSKTFKY